jgi:predicted transcriptional regulator
LLTSEVKVIKDISKTIIEEYQISTDTKYESEKIRYSNRDTSGLLPSFDGSIFQAFENEKIALLAHKSKTKDTDCYNEIEMRFSEI